MPFLPVSNGQSTSSELISSAALYIEVSSNQRPTARTLDKMDCLAQKKE
jgi:hypothetical protein